MHAANWLAGKIQLNFKGDLELSLSFWEEMLQNAKKTKDSSLVGWGFSRLAYVTLWKTILEEDPDKKREGCERLMRYAEDAVTPLLAVQRYDSLLDVHSFITQGYHLLACDVETNPVRRRNLLERAVEIGQKGLGYAEQSGRPRIADNHHTLSKALYSLSQMETQINEKTRLLEEASKHRQKSIKISEQILPFSYWVNGIYQNYAALIKAELATIEIIEDRKRNLLEEAVSHMKKCIRLCTRETTMHACISPFVV